jgi:hypothetical protein
MAQPNTPDPEIPMLRTPVRFLVLAGAATLAACDATSPSSEDREVTLAVAQASGQVVANDVSSNPGFGAEATGQGTFAGASVVELMDNLGPAGPGGLRRPLGCTLLAGTPRFDCGRMRRGPSGPGSRLGDRSFDRVVTYFAANGTAQAGYDSATTARIVFDVADTGAFSRGGRDGRTNSDSSARSRRAELSGLLGHPDTLHIWNGTGSGYQRSARSGGGNSRTTEMSANDTTTNVRYRMPRATNPWPLTGTVVRNVTVTRVRTQNDSTSTTTRTRRVVIEFNGTGTARMTVNGEAFDLDLETGEVTPRNG